MQIVALQRANLGTHFRALCMRGVPHDLMDPFLGVDHAWMSAPTFPPHPHAGFSAVSYVFLDSACGLANRDSLGSCNLIAPGGLHWTAAGRGIIHEETPADPGATSHSLQIFVNLARARQNAAPFALSLEPLGVPVVQSPGVKVRVPLGSFGGMKSPLAPPTEIRVLDIALDNGAAVDVSIEIGENAFILPIFGICAINNVVFDCDEPRMPVFACAGHSRLVELRALHGAAKAVLFSGRPLRQPVHWRGPIAMASREAVSQSFAAYQRGEFGALDNN